MLSSGLLGEKGKVVLYDGDRGKVALHDVGPLLRVWKVDVGDVGAVA